MRGCVHTAERRRHLSCRNIKYAGICPHFVAPRGNDAFGASHGYHRDDAFGVQWSITIAIVKMYDPFADDYLYMLVVLLLLDIIVGMLAMVRQCFG